MTTLVMLLAMSASLWGCEPTAKKTAEGAATAQVPARVLTPAERAAMLTARQWVVRAEDRAFAEAIMQARNQVMRQEQQEQPRRPLELDAEGKHLTLVFSGNNHGEREDCGCKHNPMGGLTRRATLITLAGKPRTDAQAYKYWGEVPEAGVQMVVDAGDLLFQDTTLRRMARERQEGAIKQAEAVIAALNVSAPDVANVGELDLALGVDVLEKLLKEAKFPFISANLKKKGAAELLLPGHKVVERDGMKVAFIGLIKERPRYQDFYVGNGVEVSAPLPAYRAQLEQLPGDIDLVVLLSNEGVPATQSLIEALRKEKLRVDAAITSNSNRLTSRPEWAEGVPVVEPMSRGKYLGRLDVWLRGEGEAQFMNDVPSELSALENYRMAWRAYLQAKLALAQSEAQAADLEVELTAPANAAAGTSPDQGVSPQDSRAAAARIKLGKMEPLLRQRGERLLLTSQEARRMAGEAEVGEHRVQGDDWAEVRVVPVLLEIPQDEVVRAAIDAHPVPEAPHHDDH